MATLKSLVDETINIKNELVECHTNLKNNLVEKGIEVLNEDKLASLIEKIELVGGKWATGSMERLYISKADVYMSTYVNTNLTFTPKLVMLKCDTAKISSRVGMNNVIISNTIDEQFHVGASVTSNPTIESSGSHTFIYLSDITSEGFCVNLGITNYNDPFTAEGVTWVAIDY